MNASWKAGFVKMSTRDVELGKKTLFGTRNFETRDSREKCPGTLNKDA